MTTNIIKDYYDRITVIVSRHYYRCNKFFCLIALIVCRGESERERECSLRKIKTEHGTIIQRPNDIGSFANDCFIVHGKPYIRKGSRFRFVPIFLRSSNVSIYKRTHGFLRLYHRSS